MITALLNIILLAIGGNDVDAAFYCFLLSVVFLSGSVLVFLGLTKTRLFKHYTQSAITLASEETSLLDPPGVNQEVSLIEVIKIIWEEEITVFLIYVVTLACFPAVTVLVQSTNKVCNFLIFKIFANFVLIFLFFFMMFIQICYSNLN